MTLKPSVEQENVLAIRNLYVTFHTYAGDVKALDGIELFVRRGEILGLVGESGGGKSVTSLAVAGLLPPNAEVASGEILLDGVDLLRMGRNEMRDARLKDIAIVFQDPMTYLNPVLTIGSQITEIVMSDPTLYVKELVENRLQEIDRMSSGAPSDEFRHERERLIKAARKNKLGRREAKRLAKLYAIEIMKIVRLPEPGRVFGNYPFELSGGMRQRCMIAMALIRRPKVFLADEITTALDVTVQAQILELLKDLKERIDSSIILITHDLAVVAEVCDRVAVMYAGNVVEVAEVNELFANPLHPYTKGLLASIPRPDTAIGELKSIKGSVPNLILPPSGCRFHPRCEKVLDRCPKEKPKLVEVKSGHLVSCFLYE